MATEFPSVTIEDKYLGVRVKMVDDGVVRIEVIGTGSAVDVSWGPRLRAILDAVVAADESMQEVCDD